MHTFRSVRTLWTILLLAGACAPLQEPDPFGLNQDVDPQVARTECPYGCSEVGDVTRKPALEEACDDACDVNSDCAEICLRTFWANRDACEVGGLFGIDALCKETVDQEAGACLDECEPEDSSG